MTGSPTQGIKTVLHPVSDLATAYATLGFEEAAHLDDGAMWPTSFALTELTAADEARIGELVKKAVS
jgi:hypothetical protein